MALHKLSADRLVALLRAYMYGLTKTSSANKHERRRAKQRSVPPERRREILKHLRRANSRAKNPNTPLRERLQILAPFFVPHENGSMTLVDRGRGGRLHVPTHLARGMVPRSNTRRLELERIRELQGK